MYRREGAWRKTALYVRKVAFCKSGGNTVRLNSRESDTKWHIYIFKTPYYPMPFFPSFHKLSEIFEQYLVKNKSSDCLINSLYITNMQYICVCKTSCCAGASGPFKAFVIKSLTAAPLLVSAHIPWSHKSSWLLSGLIHTSWIKL